MRLLLHGSYGSVLWPLTALFLHSVIFVWLFLDGSTSAQFAVYILHISFQFQFYLDFLSSIFYDSNIPTLHRVLQDLKVA